MYWEADFSEFLEQGFSEAVNKLIRDYFVKSSTGCQATLQARI